MDKNTWQRLNRSLMPEQIGPSSLLLLVGDTALLVASFMLFHHPDSGIGLRTLSISFSVLALLHFYLLNHEATHSALNSSSKINDAMGHFTGWWIVLPFLTRQRSHLLHHIWTGHPSGDPANRRLIQGFSVMTPKEGRKLERIWKTWMPVLVINDRIELWKEASKLHNQGTLSGRIQRELRANHLYGVIYLLVIAALVSTHHWVDFLFWYTPSLFLLFMLEELVNLPHHAETPLLDPKDKALPFWEQGSVTHSCPTVPFWSRYVLLNFNLHTAHHFFPELPWYTLPAANQAVLTQAPHALDKNHKQTEWRWSWHNRKRPLLSIMGHYFKKYELGDPVTHLTEDSSEPKAPTIPTPI